MSTLPLSPDELLTTTRTVRKRLDLSREVPLELIRECLAVALQAPSGSNRQDWHWVVVTDAATRRAIGEYYRQAVGAYLGSSGSASALFADDPARSAVQRRSVAVWRTSVSIWGTCPFWSSPASPHPTWARAARPDFGDPCFRKWELHARGPSPRAWHGLDHPAPQV